MNNKFNNIIKNIKTFSLRDEEKNAILLNVSFHMKNNPLPHPSLWYSNFEVFAVMVRKNKFIPIAILLVVMLGGGTSALADYSLPGDALYPIKIINEKIKSSLTIGATANAKVEVAHANERLKETSKLAVKGEISPKIKAKIKKSFNTHADNVKKLVEDIKAEGDVTSASLITSNFESQLKTSHILLAYLGTQDPKNQESINEINDSVDAQLKDTSKTRIESEAEISSSTDKEKLKAKAEASLDVTKNKIKEVDEYIKNKKDASVEQKAKALVELNSAVSITIESQSNMAIQMYGEAFLQLQKAYRIAEEAKLLFNSENEFNITSGALLELDTEQPSNENEIKSDSHSTIQSI